MILCESHVMIMTEGFERHRTEIRYKMASHRNCVCRHYYPPNNHLIILEGIISVVYTEYGPRIFPFEKIKYWFIFERAGFPTASGWCLKKTIEILGVPNSRWPALSCLLKKRQFTSTLTPGTCIWFIPLTVIWLNVIQDLNNIYVHCNWLESLSGMVNVNVDPPSRITLSKWTKIKVKCILDFVCTNGYIFHFSATTSLLCI